MDQWTGGLPPAAHERLERQKKSGTTGSLLSAPAAASIQSAGLVAVGEVFGCLVMHLGWAGGGCNWWSTGMGSGVGGGFGGGLSGMGGMGGWGMTSPVTTSGAGGYSSFAPYVKTFEAAWNGALKRMLAEARALDAHGVVGIRIERTLLEGSVWEFTALGTAVRSNDPTRVPYPSKGTATTKASDVWHTNLSAEDCASAILSGFLPREVVLGVSVSTKHEDVQLKQQRSSWVNGEVTGISALIQAARHESRVRIAAHATHAGGAELVVTDMTLTEFDTPCGQDGKDLHAESMVVGTTLIPIGFRRRPADIKLLSVMPLRDAPTPPRR